MVRSHRLRGRTDLVPAGVRARRAAGARQEHCARPAPDYLGRIPDGPMAGVEVSLRWVLIHMVEEYARHNSHADILRESIDGMTGA
ncbi:mycothiol transferase [Streptomyces hokutonensis]|uniref:mycothiol transferase n=1 Tax=Streptomyces hokutonensis TaxID=1306990 RepID=UPI0005BD77CF